MENLRCKKPKIVAIDDEQEFTMMLESYFVPRGYEIHFANRGVVGIKLIREMRPDIVLMDLKMPELDGDEALELVKELQAPPKVIFVTAYDDGGKTKARLMQMGAYAYFDKPIQSLKELEEALVRAVS